MYVDPYVDVRYAQLQHMLAEFDSNVMENYLNIFERSLTNKDVVSREIAEAQLLKYFRILPRNYLARGRISPYFQRVIDYIKEKEATEVNDDETYYHLALCHLVLGDSLRAFWYCSKIKQSDLSPEYAFVFGFSCFALGRFDQAVKFFDISERARDEIVQFDSRFAKGCVYLKLDKPTQAYNAFERLVEMNLQHPILKKEDIFLQMSMALYRRGLDVESFLNENILDRMSSQDAVKQQLYLALLREDLSACSRYECCLRLSETDFMDVLILLMYRYRCCRERNGEIGLLLALYQRLLLLLRRQSDKNWSLWFLLAMYLYQAGPVYLRDCIALLNNAYTLRPGNIWIEKSLAGALELDKRWQDATRIYHSMISGKRLPEYARYRLTQIEMFSSQPGGKTYEPPDLENIPLEAFLDSCSDTKLRHFRTSMVFCSKRMMSFLGNVEPEKEITEVHWQATCFREQPDEPVEMTIMH